MNTAVAIAPQPFYLQANQSFSASYFQRFLDYTDRKPTTMKGYLTCIRQFIAWLQQNQISQPQRDDIKNYREHLQQSGLANGTQQQYLRAVKHFFKWTAAEGLYPNVADNIHSAKIRTDIHKKDALTREAVPAIAATINRQDEQGKRLYAMYMLCIDCALRTIEINRANIEDIKTIGGLTYLYVQGKGHDDKDQVILISTEAHQAINEYLSSRTDKYTSKSPLFVSTSNRSQGGRIATTTISTMLKNLLVSAGYDSDRLTAHSLRHTANTGAYKATRNLYETQQFARHTDPATTEIYIHDDERATRNTSQKVHDYFFRGDNSQTEQEEAINLISSLNTDQLTKVIDFIKLIRK